MDTFLVVQLGDNLQMDNLLKSMLVKFEKNFVESYWQHVVMSVSKTRYTEEETKSAQGNQSKNQSDNCFEMGYCNHFLTATSASTELSFSSTWSMFEIYTHAFCLPTSFSI